MSRKKNLHFDSDVREAIRTDPEFAAEYFKELMRRPLPVQLGLLRRYSGMTQEELAKSLGLKQTHISRLEKADSDHLSSLYARAADKLGACLALVPRNLTVAPKPQSKRPLRTSVA